MSELIVVRCAQDNFRSMDSNGEFESFSSLALIASECEDSSAGLLCGFSVTDLALLNGSTRLRMVTYESPRPCSPKMVLGIAFRALLIWDFPVRKCVWQSKWRCEGSEIAANPIERFGSIKIDWSLVENELYCPRYLDINRSNWQKKTQKYVPVYRIDEVKQ